MNDLTIIIPVYKEKIGLNFLIDDLNKIKNILSFNVIFIDDGNLPKLDLTKKNLNFKYQIIANQINSGYGYSIKKAMETVTTNIVAIIDADNSYKVQDLLKLFNEFNSEKYSMIVGKRVFSYKESFARRVFRILFNSISSKMFNYKIEDINSGLRIFLKKDFLELIKYFPNKFSITSTQTLCYISEQKSIKYINIQYDKREGYSKINIYKDPFNFIFLILKIYLIYEPIKFFGSLGVILLTISFSVLFFSFLFSEKILDTTFVIFFILGINSIILGLLADLINNKK